MGVLLLLSVSFFAACILNAHPTRALRLPGQRHLYRSHVRLMASKRPSISAETEGVRLNKCLSSLSRRVADTAIASGRVSVNGVAAGVGTRVIRGDIVRLDGKRQHWEEIAAVKQQTLSVMPEDERELVYLKYWKPVGVTCTNDVRDRTNIISSGKFSLFPQRLFTVGRLDKDSSGLILLTSDGRVNNSLLGKQQKKEKVYEVEMDLIPSDLQISQLRTGVAITTPVQKDKKTEYQTAQTLPCHVVRLFAGDSRWLRFTLTEGRNRQIRRMAEAVGLQVVSLHRTQFAGITLRGLAEGEWLQLNKSEMRLVCDAVNRKRAPNDS